MKRSPFSEFWPAALVALGSALLFVVAAIAGWPGESWTTLTVAASSTATSSLPTSCFTTGRAGSDAESGGGMEDAWFTASV